jgi:four helix bundle protein
MSKFTRFEEIEAWKSARDLNLMIYKITNQDAFQKDYSLINQMRRSGGSVMDNIAEGFGREGNKEFQHFLPVAKGSAIEVKSQLYRALDQDYVSKEQFETIYRDTDTICRLIAGLIKYLRNSELKGIKFKQPQKPRTEN